MWIRVYTSNSGIRAGRWIPWTGSTSSKARSESPLPPFGKGGSARRGGFQGGGKIPPIPPLTKGGWRSRGDLPHGFQGACNAQQAASNRVVDRRRADWRRRQPQFLRGGAEGGDDRTAADRGAARVHRGLRAGEE